MDLLLKPQVRKDVIISLPVCGVAAANIPPMHLFKNPIKPIATKSKRFNLEDQKFIQSEIKKLLDENIRAIHVSLASSSSDC